MAEPTPIYPQVPQADDDDEPPFTVAEVARMLGYKKSTVYEMIARKILGCTRPPGMDIRIYRSHIREYKKAFECPAQSSNAPATGSSREPAGESGTSPGPRTAPAGTTAQVLRYRTRARMNRNLAKRQKPS